MTLKFYNISDDPRTLTKGLRDTGADANLIKTVTAKLKGDSSVGEPVFEIKYDGDLLSANYFYVVDWSRYYFIPKPSTLSMQRMFVQGRCDVLMTYRTQIKELVCVIERQEDRDRCDMYLPDKAFRQESRHIVQCISFPNSFHKENSSFVLATGGVS